MKRYKANYSANARQLRKNMTQEEKHLWYDFLKKLPLTFYRQKILGPYIVDFYCREAKLVIELDGSQHFEADALEADRQRDKWLAEQGLSVLRYTNTDIRKDFNLVCEDILRRLEESGLMNVEDYECFQPSP